MDHEELDPPARHEPGRARAVGLALLLVAALVAAAVAVGPDRITGAVRTVAGREEAEPAADPDGDRDGLSADIETVGFSTEAGDTFATDPREVDTDGDGLSDGEEAGALLSGEDVDAVYAGISDPTVADTDGDGVEDGDEYFLGTDPRSEDSDDDGLSDADELTFGSDPLVDNPDDDDYSDEEERERGSAPMTYDESGWKAKLDVGVTALKAAFSAADKYVGGKKLAALVQAAGAAKVAAPIIWRIVRTREWPDVDPMVLVKEAFGEDVDAIGKTLEGGDDEYVAFVARTPDGDIAYAGVTRDFEVLTASHGGLNTLSVVGPDDPMPLGQARAIAEAVIQGVNDDLGATRLANRVHAIAPTDNLYAPAMTWGREQLAAAEFKP